MRGTRGALIYRRPWKRNGGFVLGKLPRGSARGPSHICQRSVLTGIYKTEPTDARDFFLVRDPTKALRAHIRDARAPPESISPNECPQLPLYLQMPVPLSFSFIAFLHTPARSRSRTKELRIRLLSTMPVHEHISEDEHAQAVGRVTNDIPTAAHEKSVTTEISMYISISPARWTLRREAECMRGGERRGAHPAPF